MLKICIFEKKIEYSYIIYAENSIKSVLLNKMDRFDKKWIEKRSSHWSSESRF